MDLDPQINTDLDPAQKRSILSENGLLLSQIRIHKINADWILIQNLDPQKKCVSSRSGYGSETLAKRQT